MIPLHAITGLVLAGGRGQRMGGLDKGLQPHRGLALARHALDRLRPQVGQVAVNANRHLDQYAAFGCPVWPDELPGHLGPLAGLLAGLQRADTPWLAVVPCDTPHFPLDLVRRLAAGAEAEGAAVALAACLDDGRWCTQPVFCLVDTRLQADLAGCLAAGERQVGRWAARHRPAVVAFDDGAAFFNANTPDDLRRLQHGPG